MLPQDPMMLLSVVNTALRDSYSSLDDYCAAENVDKEELMRRLDSIDYSYDGTLNKFV